MLEIIRREPAEVGLPIYALEYIARGTENLIPF